MKVRVQKNNKVLTITALDGKFEGEVIGEVESIQLGDATFEGDTITGRPEAVWGARFRDDVHDCAKTVRKLGIGGNFDVRVRNALKFDKEEALYRFADTGFVIRGARRVVVKQEGVFWR